MYHFKMRLSNCTKTGKNMIKIIIDSASDIDGAEAEKSGLILIPMEIRFEKNNFFDGVDITKTEFFEKLIESAELPKTSQINPQRFEDEFEKIAANGDSAIVITISSKLSGTYSNAKKAAQNYKGKIFVIDSLSAAAGERILCEYARKLISRNLNIEEIVGLLEEKKKQIVIVAMLSTLKYLKKGGRISAISALAGEMLMIKPVIGVINGEVKLLGKAVGSKKGGNLLTKLTAENGIDFQMPYSAIYSGLSDRLIKKYIEDSKELWEGKTDRVPVYMIGSTIGAHIGPDAIGVAFFRETK